MKTFISTVAAGVGGAGLSAYMATSVAKIRMNISVPAGRDLPMLSMPGIEHVLGIPFAGYYTVALTRVLLDNPSKLRLFSALAVGAFWYTIAGRVLLCYHYNPQTGVCTTVYKPFHFAYTGRWGTQIKYSSGMSVNE